MKTMKLNGKTIYAQSSDIKSRTYLKYRRDMKKKAIAELEVLEWLQHILEQLHPNKRVKVYKSGGDKFLWFLRKGGISREPDFIAEIGDEKTEFEFQYVNADIDNFYFNFKSSKLIKKGSPQRHNFSACLAKVQQNMQLSTLNGFLKILTKLLKQLGAVEKFIELIKKKCKKNLKMTTSYNRYGKI